jgi:hypothetical protein
VFPAFGLLLWGPFLHDEVVILGLGLKPEATVRSPQSSCRAQGGPAVDLMLSTLVLIPHPAPQCPRGLSHLGPIPCLESISYYTDVFKIM